MRLAHVSRPAFAGGAHLPYRSQGRQQSIGQTLFTLAIFSVLASIAGPAYFDYTERSRVADAIQAATTGRVPTVEGVQVIATDGAITIQFSPRRFIVSAGYQVQLVPAGESGWRCGPGTTAPRGYLHHKCRESLTVLGVSEPDSSAWQNYFLLQLLITWLGVVLFFVLAGLGWFGACTLVMFAYEIGTRGLRGAWLRVSPTARAIFRDDEAALARKLERLRDSPEVKAKSGAWLRIAAEDYHPRVVNLLLRAGAPLSSADDKGATALHVASDRRIVELLLRHGAPHDVRDQDGRTPLHYAAAGSIDTTVIVDVLLAHGACVAAADHRGRTPLDDAIERGHPRVAELMRRHAETHTDRGRQSDR